MDVEWDEGKRRWNLVKHGVDFGEAALIFLSATVEAEDRRQWYGERRIRALGQVDGTFYLVVFTWRGAVRRIISAWRVDEDGQRRYQAILAGRS